MDKEFQSCHIRHEVSVMKSRSRLLRLCFGMSWSLENLGKSRRYACSALKSLKIIHNDFTSGNNAYTFNCVPYMLICHNMQIDVNSLLCTSLSRCP